MQINGTSPKQIRAARALLGWSQAELAKNCGLAITTVSQIETELFDARLSTLQAIHKCFTEHGIEFVSTSDGAIGVICHKA